MRLLQWRLPMRRDVHRQSSLWISLTTLLLCLCWDPREADADDASSKRDGSSVVLDFHFQARACGFGKEWRAHVFDFCCHGRENDLARAHVCWPPSSNRTKRELYRPDLCCNHFASINLSAGCTPELTPLTRPSSSQPCVFLHVPRVGGTSFERYLEQGARQLRVQSLISSYSFNVVGTPFFVKFYKAEVRRQSAIVAGHLDWDLIGSDALDCKTRRALHCVVLLRHPVDRFVSYYARNSGVIGEDWSTLPAAHLRSLLELSNRQRLGIREEEGAACSRSVGLCYNLNVSGIHGRNFTRMLRLEDAQTRQRYALGAQYGAQWGPLDALAWMLDPESADVKIASARLRTCLPGLFVEEPLATQRLFKHYFPWLNLGQVHWEASSKARRLREHLVGRPDLVRLIEDYNRRDIELYQVGRLHFWSLLAALPMQAYYVWSYWEGPPMPPLLKLCIETWQFRGCERGTDDRRVRSRVLTPGDFDEVQFSTPDGWNILRAAQRADYLKVHLLQRFGGLWLDVDTILTHEPSLATSVFARLTQKEMVAWTIKSPSDTTHVAVWAVAARPGARALDEWRSRNSATLSKAVESKQDSVPWPSLGAWQLSFLMEWVAQGYNADVRSGSAVHPVRWDQQHRLLGNESLRALEQPFLSLNAETIPQELLRASRAEILSAPWAISRFIRAALWRTRHQCGTKM